MRRIVIGACLILLIGGAASAAGTKAGTQKCTQALMQAETLFYGKIKAKALKEETAEAISKLLDEADAFCTAGNYPQSEGDARQGQPDDVWRRGEGPRKGPGIAFSRREVGGPNSAV